MMKTRLFAMLIVILLLVAELVACGNEGMNNLDDINPNTRLATCIENGWYEGAKEALDFGANVDKIKASDITLLSENVAPAWYAMSRNKLKIFEYLLEYGADVSATDKYDLTLLMYAAQAQHQGSNQGMGGIQYCELLLAHGAEINQTNKERYTALDYAARDGTYDPIFYYLLNNGATIRSETMQAMLTAKTSYKYPSSLLRYDIVRTIVEHLSKSGQETGLSPLFEAIVLGDNEKALTHLNTENFDEDDRILWLDYVVAFGSVEVFELLFHEKSITEKSSERTQNLINIASKYGNLQLVKYLLSLGASVEHQNSNKETPLFLAASNGQVDIVVFLLSQNAKMIYPEKRTHGVETQIEKDAFIEACRYGHTQVADLLLANGYIATLDKLYYAFDNAISIGNCTTELADYLFQLGADVNYIPPYETFCLLENACLRSNFELTEYLLSKGATGNTKVASGQEGKTSFYYAADAGSTEIISLLFRNGEKLVHPDNFFSSPLYVATAKGYLDVVKLLVEGGAEKQEMDAALRIAAERSWKITEYLIANGADVDTTDADGKTSLIIAASNGNTKQVEILLSNGADTEIKDINGFTAAEYAKKKGHMKTYSLLMQNKK